MDNFDDLFSDAGISATEVPTAEVRHISVELDSEVLKFEPTDTLFKYGQAVLSCREDVAKAQIGNAEAMSMRSQINAEKEALRRSFDEQMMEISNREIAIREAVQAGYRAITAAQRAVKDAEQQLRDALIAQANNAKLRQAGIEFDETTKSLSWRVKILHHQTDGAMYLANAKRGVLADKMGLGKTLTSLASADMLKVNKLLVIVPDDVASNFVNEIVYWAPHRHVVMVGKRAKVERDMIFNILLPTLTEFTVVVNYSAWRRDKGMLDQLIDCRFEMVIMDEAHSIKNVRTSAFKGCEKIVLAVNSCPVCSGRIQLVHDDSEKSDWNQKRDFNICVGEQKVSTNRLDLDQVFGKGCGWSEESDRAAGVKRDYFAMRSIKNIITMTGTPILNKPTDIFAMLRLIDPITYSSEADFVYNYCARGMDNKIVFRAGGMESLVKRLSGIYIGRDRGTAGVVLPKQGIIQHHLEFDKVKYADQARVIKQLNKHAALMLSDGKVLPIPAIIALITRKRQATVWPAGIEIKDPETGIVVFRVADDVDQSQKLDFILESPETTDSKEWEGLAYDLTGGGDKINGERVVIFSQFKTPLRELERRFNAAGISVARFDGDTNDLDRNEMKVDFDRKFAHDTEYKWQVILCNYKTGGVGLNFTAATQVIELDSEWNPGKRDQAYARVDRMGQTEETTVHRIILDESIDKWIEGLVESKENMINAFEDGASMQQAFAEFLKSEDM